MHPVVIVGTGHAGYAAAREFRKHDATTPLVMVTADDGTSYTKPMLSNAMARGKTPAELAQASATEMGEQLDARMITHARVTSIDAANRRLHFSDGGELDAAKIVLGIGANQIDPHLSGDGAEDVLAVNDLDSYARAREALEHARRVVLIGGGLIGCEFANDWVNAGYEVTIIEALDYPMGRALPPQAGAALRSALLDTGVNVVTGRKVTAVERDGEGLVVVDDGDERHPADVAVRALGLRPRTRLAEEAGIEVGQGIRTDRGDLGPRDLRTRRLRRGRRSRAALRHADQQRRARARPHARRHGDRGALPGHAGDRENAVLPDPVLRAAGRRRGRLA